MAEKGEVVHHDSTRSGVGKTAFGVAGCRAAESSKPEDQRLIYDELAIKIVAENEHIIKDEYLNLLTPEKKESMINGLAVRTRKIDEEILASFTQGVNQVVVIGAGLDFRPWRMHQYYKGGEEETTNLLKDKKWFEVDFKELFDYKLNLIQQAKAKTYVNYHPVIGNACIDDWEKGLFDNGFDKNERTVWLLEGFTGYLTEEEVRKVFASISSLSSIGSKLIATFLGPTFGASLDMHRFKTATPALFLSEWNWKGSQQEFTEVMAQYNRPSTGWEDYYLAIVFNEL